MRKFLIGIVVLLIVLVAAAFVAPQLVPTDTLKADIAEEVRAATGRELAIDGDLSFTVLPSPRVSVSGVRVSNIDGAQADEMVRLRAAQVTVALGPLLTGRFEIDRVILIEPVFELEQLADGRNNWTLPPAPTAPGQSSGQSDTVAGSGGPGPSVRLNDLVVRNGTFVFRSPDITERIEGINASFGAASLRGPFRAEGELVLRGMPAQLRAAVGELEIDRAIPVNLATGVQNAEVTLSGVLSGFPNDLRLIGQLEGKADDSSSLAAMISGQPPSAGLGNAPLTIKSDLSASRDRVALNNLSVGLAGVNATGAANVALGETPEVELILNAGQLDLDQLLADIRSAEPKASGAAVRQRAATASGRAAAPQTGSAAAPDERGFALPGSLNATIETKIDAVLYRGGVIRQATLNAQLDDGELTISQLTAQLPGSADISLFGFVNERDGAPAFSGQGEANADDLRGLLSWLGVDLPSVPLDRLRKLALTTKLDGVREQLNLTEIDLGIDGSRIRGGIAIALRERLGLGIGISLDKLNIDAYLPTEAATPAAAGTGDASPSADAPQSPASPGENSAGLAFLDKFDSVVQFKAGTLTYRGKSIQGVNLDGTLVAGALDLRDASVKSLAGASASASGRIEGLATRAPNVDLSIDIDAKESDRLLEMLGAAPSFTVGPGRLQGAVKGNLDEVDIDLTLDALNGQFATKGKVAPLAENVDFDLALDLRHGDARALFDRIGGNGTAGDTGSPAGPLRLAGAATGNLAKSAFSAAIDVGGGSLNVKGQVSNSGPGQVTGGVDVAGSHPDLASAVRLFLPGYRPALAEPGPLKFSADLAFDPTTLRIDNLRGNAGPVTFDSNANVALDRARPRVAGELKTSEIIVDWFLPVQRRAAPAGGSAAGSSPSGGQAATSGPAGERWSSEPIDLSALRSIDADIALTAPSITYTNLTVDKPKVAVTLADGILDLSELSGRAYGGAFSMTGQVAARETPSVRYALTIDEADAARLTGAAGQEGRGVMSVLDVLFPVSSVKLTSGKLSAKIDAASQGRSERELIRALSGQGDVTFVDARAEGVDVCRISNQLDNLNGLEGFLGLVLSAQGGATNIENYAGRFEIAKGIATLPRQRISADCATVDIAGNVDLPRWLIEIRAQALFPEHPKFPGIVVEEKGQLDAPNTRLVNSNQVQQYIIGKSAGSVLRKLVPEAEEQSVPQADSGSQPTPAPQPAEQFRNLLNDLLKGR